MPRPPIRQSGASSSPGAARRSSPAPTSAISSATSRRERSTQSQSSRGGQALLRAIETCAEAGHRAPAWHGARRRCRACPRVPRDSRYAEGVTGFSRNGHRNLSRPRRYAADAAPHRYRPRQVARLSGQTVGAEEARAIGLIDKVVPYDKIDAAIAETIAEGRTDSKRTVPGTHTTVADLRPSRYRCSACRLGAAERRSACCQGGQENRRQSAGRAAPGGRAHRSGFYQIDR